MPSWWLRSEHGNIASFPLNLFLATWMSKLIGKLSWCSIFIAVGCDVRQLFYHIIPPPPTSTGTHFLQQSHSYFNKRPHILILLHTATPCDPVGTIFIQTRNQVKKKYILVLYEQFSGLRATLKNHRKRVDFWTCSQDGLSRLFRKEAGGKCLPWKIKA